MANLLGTTVNGALSASGRISVTYDTDRYQFNFLRASGSNWWVTNDSTALGLHVNNVGDKFYFSASGDFYSDTNGWLSTALAGKLSLSGGTMSGDIIFPNDSSAGLRNAAANAGFRLDDQYGNMYSYNLAGGYFVDATSYYFRSAAAANWMTISGGTVTATSDFRAPIFYDSNDTAYYIDPNSTSRLQSLWLRGASQYDGELYIGGTSAGSALRINYDQIWTPNGNLHLMYSGAGNIDMNYGGGYTFSRTSLRAPIFYDYNDTTYYFDGNSTTSLRTKGSWRADSADWDGEYSGKIQYHANNWYFQSASAWLFRSSGGSNVVSISQGGNISVSGYVGDNSGQTRDKLRVWDSSQYTIGMKNGYDYGHLGNDEYAMSFQMNDNSGRGFWWGDTGHSDDQGAASLTTDGRMVIAKSLSIGEGEAVVSPSSTPLYVKGTTSGADVVGVDGINGRLFTVTDDLSGSLFSVNTIAGLPVIEAFADNTVTIGKYGYATTWSTTGFMTVPNSANIYRDLFINGGRSGDFGNRLIIGTDATTYTMNDGNLRPIAYLHGAYPVLTLNHTVTSNGSHGPTIQFTHNTEDKQWVIGSNGAGTRLDIGYSTNTNRNPHNGIDDLNGSTFIRVDNGGNVQLGRGNGRSTWVNDTLYVGASDSGDSHMYFGEDSSNWYGLHWYWDSGYIVYLYGRNAGTDTEIMRYTTNSNAYVEWRRHFHMNNYEINYVSQLHFNNNTRFVNNSANYLNFQIGSDSYGSIQVRDNSNNVKGYLGYFDSNGFGLLNSSGSWGIRLNPGNGDTVLYSGGTWKLTTTSAGVAVDGNVYTNQNYGHGLVGLYASTRYQGVFAMGDSYKLAADGTGTGTLYGIAWTHTNVGGESKSGLGHQALFMDNGVTQTAIGSGIWTVGLITTTSYGTSANWNTAYGWGNHASAGYQAASTAITTSNIASQSVSNATTVGGITPIQFFNNMGDSHATRTSFDASTPSYNFGFRFIQGNTNGPALGGGGQFYSWYLGLGNDYPATGAGSYGMHVAIPRSAVTPYMSVRYNENNSLGSWIKIAAGYADTAGALTSMNISQFTNNSGYITSSSLSSYLPLAGGSMTGDINMSSNTGIQYTSTHWIRPRDSSGNLHIKADSGGIYLDADVIHLRGLGGVNDTTVSGGNITTAGGYYTNAGLSTNGSNGALTVQSPGGASRGNASSSETGAFKIKLPAGLPVYGMFKLVIHIYEYGNRGNGYEIHCGGHMYPNYMYNRFQVQYGASNSPLTVRYGNDGSTGCIWIGNLDTTWSYPQIWVSEFMIGYSNTSWATWRSGWSITLDSASFGNSGAMDGPYTCEFGYAATANYAATSGSATTAGSLTSMNISQFTNNSGYITGSYVVANGTSAGNIDADWGQSFKTFDPVPSGTPPLASPNIRTINVGDDYNRRTQLAFDYASDVAYFRRRNDSGWQTWREFIHSGNIGTQSVNYATTAGSAPNAGNINPFYNVTAGVGNGLRFWGGDDNYKISMGVGGLYQYGPVTDYSIKTQMDVGSPGRGFTWGNNGVTPVAALNATSGNMQIAGTFTASNFSGSSSGTNTGDQTNISGNAATASAVAWDNITSKPSWMINASLIGSHSNADSQVNSGFYENGGGGSNWPAGSATWYNSINVRHSNQGNYHGFQVAMSYYDNLLWFRSYQGSGTFQSWVYAISSANIGSQSVLYAATAGALTSMNISQFTNNSGYITGYTETNTFLGDGGSADTHPGTDRLIFTGQLSLGAPVLGMPSTDNSNAIININRHPGEYNSQLGFSSNGSMYYRSFSAVAINNTLAWRQVWDSGNLTNLNQLTNGPGYITGNQTITLSGDVSGSGTTSIVVTVNNIDGWGFVNTGSNSPINADTINSNGISYYTAGVTNFSGNATDGALYSQRYGDSWQHQIAGDYRSGMIAVRGKNNGTWTSWKTIIDSSTIGSQSVSYATSAGSASSATIASTVTVNSGNTSAAWYPIVWHSGNTVYSSSGAEIYAAGNYIRCQYINTTDNDESGITRFVIKNGDSYHRSATTTVAADIIRGVASGSWGINITGSSATATTANRLERYGVIYGNNWNDYYLNNRLIAASAHNATGTNKPDGAYTYGSTLSYYNSGEDHYQIYVTENNVNSNGKDRKMYYRSGWNGNWGGWRSVVDVYNSVCYIDAAVTATGDITAFSDGRVKENVETLEGALDKTLKLRGVSYNRTDIEDKSTKIGVIAQEILEVVPEVVSQDENGMYAVSYGNITALLIEAIKEQQKQIDELKEIINGLTK